MVEAVAGVRSARSTRARLSKVGSARDTIDGFGHGVDVAGLTFGQFSLLDLVEAALGVTGPADVAICTWSAGFYDVEHLARVRDSGLLRSIRFVIDSSGKRGQATVADVANLFGAGSVRATRTHAKFVTLTNEAWSVVVTTSMNLNLNARIEQFEMTDDVERAGLFLAFVDGLFGELKPGDTRDRSLPVLAGVPAVSAGRPAGDGSVFEATLRSVDAAVSAGRLDRDLSSGPIEALLMVARLLDHPEFPMAGGRLDNVSLPTYLKFVQELGLTPGPVRAPTGVEPKVEVVEVESEPTGLARFQAIAGGKLPGAPKVIRF
jgi:hypothetical protein